MYKVKNIGKNKWGDNIFKIIYSFDWFDKDKIHGIKKRMSNKPLLEFLKNEEKFRGYINYGNLGELIKDEKGMKRFIEVYKPFINMFPKKLRLNVVISTQKDEPLENLFNAEALYIYLIFGKK